MSTLQWSTGAAPFVATTPTAAYTVTKLVGGKFSLHINGTDVLKRATLGACKAHAEAHHTQAHHTQAHATTPTDVPAPPAADPDVVGLGTTPTEPAPAETPTAPQSTTPVPCPTPEPTPAVELTPTPAVGVANPTPAPVPATTRPACRTCNSTGVCKYPQGDTLPYENKRCPDCAPTTPPAVDPEPTIPPAGLALPRTVDVCGLAPGAKFHTRHRGAYALGVVLDHLKPAMSIVNIDGKRLEVSCGTQVVPGWPAGTPAQAATTPGTTRPAPAAPRAELALANTTAVPVTATEGPGGKKRFTIWDLPVTAVLRWLGSDAWTFDDARKALLALGLTHVADNTVRAQLYSGKLGEKGPHGKVPTLSTEQQKALYALIGE